jgi:hypothetical protein
MSRRDRRQMDLFDEKYLAVQPWAPAPGIVVGRDQFVTTKKDHRCFQCTFPIGAGARVRARAEIDRIGHQAVTFYFCQSCCRKLADQAGAGERRSA